MATLTLENVSKVYRSGASETHALRGVSLSIEKGEFVAIMGPSGSGKSTLLHIVGLLDRPSSGRYIFFGREVDSLSDDTHAQLRNESIGHVFQSFYLLPRTTVLENVMLPFAYSHVDRATWSARSHAAIEQVGLSHRIDHLPSQLSGGEQQRVAIARALVHNPAIICADEPTGNLDSATGTRIMGLLAQLHAGGTRTILLITHDRNVASYAQRVISMRDGSIDYAL